MFHGLILRALSIGIVLIILLQPTLSHIDSLQNTYIKSLAHYTAEKSAPNGYVDQATINYVKQELMKVGFSEGSITINYTNSLLDRGELLEVTILVKRTNMFIYRFKDIDVPEYFVAHSQTISEYID